MEVSSGVTGCGSRPKRGSSNRAVGSAYVNASAFMRADQRPNTFLTAGSFVASGKERPESRATSGEEP
ncbi:hypothetical protein [Streptomyces sp. E-08]|uniref:hypothetical protein n=1 Tax=Streptomyces sp. E-08 TaxID=3404047 RepID=UPI003CE7527D